MDRRDFAALVTAWLTRLGNAGRYALRQCMQRQERQGTASRDGDVASLDQPSQGRTWQTRRRIARTGTPWQGRHRRASRARACMGLARND